MFLQWLLLLENVAEDYPKYKDCAVKSAIGYEEEANKKNTQSVKHEGLISQ